MMHVRGSLLAALALSAAVGFGPGAAAQTLGQGNPKWQEVLAAAKSEKLTLMAMTGGAYADIVTAFKKAYPDITVEMTQARPGDITTRIVAEQQNGRYLWDVFWGPTNNLNAVLVPGNAVQDIRPFFVLLEVTDDKHWMGGFERYAQDITKRPLAFMAQMSAGTGGFAVNNDTIPKGALKSWNDLLDPKWRGKIVIYDPTRPVTGSIHLSCALPVVGESYVRRLHAEQKLVANGDARLITDWLVRSRYPIVIGLSSSFLPNYQKEGLGKNIEEVGDTVCRGMGGPGVAVLTNAPHPNAAKVFVNWLLSRQAQEMYTQIFWPFDQTFSRRADVAPPSDPEVQAAIELLKAGKGIATGSETHQLLMEQVIAIAKEFYSAPRPAEGKK